MAVAGFTLFVLGIMFLFLYRYIRKKQTRCSAQTQGILREIRANTSDESSIPEYEYHYYYYVDGIEYRLKTFDRSPETETVGDTCTIWYNPAKPKQALAHYYESLKYFKILLIGGIVMVPLGIVLTMIGLSR